MPLQNRNRRFGVMGKRSRTAVKASGLRRRPRKRVKIETERPPLPSLRGNTAIVHRNPSGLPASRTATLKYCASVVLGTTGALGDQRLRANSCFDPDISGTGHQPMGFDQFMTYYKRCFVTGSRLKAIFQVDSSSSAEAQVCGITIHEGNTFVHDEWPEMAEQSNTVWNQTSPDWDSSSGKVTLYAKFDSAKYFNVKSVVGELGYFCLDDADATTQAQFILWKQSADGSTVSNMRVTFEVEYDCVFSVPKELVSS